MTAEATGSFVSGYEAYWRRSRDETQQAIKTSVIVLDTNSIVNLYRMASGGRDEYFAVLDNVADRLWVPRQVADEFHKIRLSAVASHISGLKSKADAVGEAAETLKKALRDFARLYSLANGRVSEYMEPLDAAISSILTHVHGDVEGFDLDPGTLASVDPILDRLAELLNGKVGEGVPEGDLQTALDEAKRRGEEQVPPGYKDWEEKGQDGLGDYLIWQEMLTLAKSHHRNILFVSTDIKDDWLRRQAGFVIGPRPELVQEMRDEAGVSYHHITLAEFLRTASAALGVFVSANTISRAQELERARGAATRELAERVAVLRHALLVATAERDENSQILAATSERHKQVQARLHSLRERADAENTDRQKNARLMAEFDMLSGDLHELREREEYAREALARSSTQVAEAGAQWATLEQKLAESDERY
ncbi:PIN-like domain-containing protein [Streptomyces sp. NPDC005244]|uniref:PIN-like domain-containing protein n=1 Tax=Streptomyces sp. NPDC005244 TaxID=3364708 RepID=UPI0036BD68A6